jgi:hypothetical protein
MLATEPNGNREVDMKSLGQKAQELFRAGNDHIEPWEQCSGQCKEWWEGYGEAMAKEVQNWSGPFRPINIGGQPYERACQVQETERSRELSARIEGRT